MSGDPLLSGKFERDTGGTAGSGIQTLALVRALSGQSGGGGGGSNVSGFWQDQMHQRTVEMAERQAELSHSRQLEINAQEHKQSLSRARTRSRLDIAEKTAQTQAESAARIAEAGAQAKEERKTHRSKTRDKSAARIAEGQALMDMVKGAGGGVPMNIRINPEGGAEATGIRTKRPAKKTTKKTTKKKTP